MFTPLVFGAIDRASTHLLRPTGSLKIQLKCWRNWGWIRNHRIPQGRVAAGAIHNCLRIAAVQRPTECHDADTVQLQLDAVK